MKLTFKKAFGFDFMPADAAFWMLELGHIAYSFAVRATPVAISVGRFGRTEQELDAIDGFMTPGNRPFGHEIITLDVALEDTSNRLLCTVVLGAVGVGDTAIRDRLVSVFNGRNSLAHGKRSGAERDEARAALDIAETFLTAVGAIPVPP